MLGGGGGGCVGTARRFGRPECRAAVRPTDTAAEPNRRRRYHRFIPSGLEPQLHVAHDGFLCHEICFFCTLTSSFWFLVLACLNFKPKNNIALILCLR